MADRARFRIDALRTAAVTVAFVVVGPFIGFLIALGWSLSRVPAEDEALRSLMLLSGVFTVVVAYIVGAPMALITGLIAAATSHRLTSGVVWVALTTLLGAAVAALTQPLFAPGTERLLVTTCGAVAALACAAMTVAIRPRSGGDETSAAAVIES